MDIDVVGLISRWLHILAAITAVGGTIFMRLALVPSISVLPDDQRKSLHGEIRSRWSKLIMASILFLIVSGLYNYIMLVRAARDWPEPGLPALYHQLFGAKFVLALGVFFMASALSGRGAATEKFRQNAKYWMTVNLILALAIVCISGYMRMMHTGPNVTGSDASAQRAV